MDSILTAVLGSMHLDMARVERVSMNIANAQTAAFKREGIAPAQFGQRVQAQGQAMAVYTDERPGTLRNTGQSLDFALASPGWFEVTTPEGTAYTRSGNFRTDANGRVVTQQGYAVNGLAGEIVLPHGAPTVDSAGRVFEGPTARQGATPLAQLKVVRFAPGAQLQKLGDGMVRVQGTPVATSDDAVQVRQGFLENSNVNPLEEMVRLMEAMRHVETLQKVALGYDEMLGNTIRKLGDTP
jgi:flagellar basal-body rod protein FlgF